MKSPSWMYLEHVRGNLYRIYIKWWHPACWASVFQTLRASGAGILSSTYYTGVFVWHMARR